MNSKAFRSFSYGLYLVSTVDAQGRSAGCVVNTAAQVSSRPYRILVTINKDNATCRAVQQTGKFALTVLSQDATMELIGTFGFHSSADLDKFAGLNDVRELMDGVPCVADSAVAILGCTVCSATDAGSHVVFVADVNEAEVVNEDGTPLTYDYYHRVLKGTTPPKASAFIAEETVASEPAEEQPVGQMHHFRCNLCGYVFETEAEELPADFKCPLCGAGASMFKKVD